MWNTLKEVLQINTAVSELLLMCDRIYWTSQWHQNYTQKTADMTGENSKNFYPYTQYMKMKTGRRWSTHGNVSLWKALRIMQVSIPLGDNTWMWWKDTRKTTRKEPKNWRWWYYADVHSKQPAKQKIHFLHGKGIDQVMDNLGTRLQM